MTLTVCFHGAESTGKSVLASKLSAQLACPWVPEYGRSYCEKHGTDLAMADLLAIAAGQAQANHATLAGQPALILHDTDQLMTAAWAEMLFGSIPEVLMNYPKADLYLLFEADTQWIDDGTRFFGKGPLRSRFAALAEGVLIRAGVRFERISGDWAQREAQVRAALQAATAVTI